MPRTASLLGALVGLLLPVGAGWGSDPVRHARSLALADSLSATLSTVPTVDVQTIPDNAVLVDVRDEVEQAVSRIPGAVPLSRFEPDERPAVFYCTVGYRSHKHALDWQAKGVQSFNLRGGVLAWSHEGRAFEHDGHPTRAMHVYSRWWDLSPRAYRATW